MSSSRFRPELYRAVIHPLMSISVSFFGMLASVWLVGVNVGLPAPRLATVVAMLVATILEAVAGNLLYRERAGVGNRVRELLIYLIVVYGAFSIAQPGALLARFVPTFGAVLPVFAVAGTWIVAYVFHDRLRGREALLRALAGRSDGELRRAIIERQHEMALTVRQLRKARSVIGSIFVVLCMLAVLAALDPFGVSVLRAGSGAFVVLVIYGVAAAASMGAIHGFIEEYAANGEGLSVAMRFTRRRAIAAAMLILLVLVLSFALSRNEAVLPLEAIGDFFRWLAGLFRGDAEVEMEPPPMPAPQQEAPPPDIGRLMEEVELREPPLWLRILARLFERLALTVMIVGGAVLLFGPLLSPAFRKALLGLRPGRFLADLWARLRRRLRIIGRFIRHGLRRRRRAGREEDEPGREADTWRAAAWKPDLRKRRQMDRVTALFVEITEWGGRHGVPYRRTLATREYLAEVAAVRPERYADAMFVSDVFCEARFSRHLVPRERMRELAQAARRIARGE